jgi:mono/diheme cytochrome c family protein
MSNRLSRWGAPITYFSTVLFVGAMLIAVLARSPDTRSNFQESAVGYDRTNVAVIGAQDAFGGITNELGADPAAAYVGTGCANCHGLSGEGGVVGPDIWSKNFEDMLEIVRDGEHGMPAFDDERLSDAQVEALVTYLNALREEEEAITGTSSGS